MTDIYSADWQMEKYKISLNDANKSNLLKEKIKNIYSVEYHMNKFGLSEELAIIKIKNIKKSIKDAQKNFSHLTINLYHQKTQNS